MKTVVYLTETTQQVGSSNDNEVDAELRDALVKRICSIDLW
jgi:hypothetical protein